jgi:5-oxopent-3-ene-1,2,5-tricarboxylate decarboxylase/2-hydroxyhepta-2,4-diene-1,7-dioate isomerase
VLVADLSVPYTSHYRPGARFKARDGSCLVGVPVAPPAGFDPDSVTLRVDVDGQAVQTVPMAGLRRNAAQLLADVSEFMTLNPGDLLLLGVRVGAPLLRAGQRFGIEAAALGRLEGRLVAAEGARA